MYVTVAFTITMRMHDKVWSRSWNAYDMIADTCYFRRTTVMLSTFNEAGKNWNSNVKGS